MAGPHLHPIHNRLFNRISPMKPKSHQLTTALEQAAEQFDSIAKALTLGQTLSVGSVQNCAALARMALENRRSLSAADRFTEYALVLRELAPNEYTVVSFSHIYYNSQRSERMLRKPCVLVPR